MMAKQLEAGQLSGWTSSPPLFDNTKCVVRRWRLSSESLAKQVTDGTISSMYKFHIHMKCSKVHFQ